MRHSIRCVKCIMAVALVGGVVTALAGCATPSHQEAKNAAMDRWQSARTGISYGQALQQFEVGDLEKAARTIGGALEAMPENGRYRVLAARIAMEQSKLERAFRHLEVAVDAEPKHAPAHYYKGVVLQRWQQYEEALSAYERAHELDPENVSGLLAVAEMLVALGRSDAAIDRLNEKLVYFEHNAAIRLTLGRILLKEGQPERAIKMFRDAQVLAPDQPAALEQLAMAEYAAGRFGDAAQHLRQLLSMEEMADRRDLKMALADCHVRTGRPVDARRLYLDLVESDEDSVEAWVALGEVAYVLGDQRQLQRAGRKVVTLAPSRPEGHLLRGLAAERGASFVEAVQRFGEAADRAPEQATPWMMQGVALERLGRLDEARRAYERAERLSPDDPRVAELLAGLTDHERR